MEVLVCELIELGDGEVPVTYKVCTKLGGLFMGGQGASCVVLGISVCYEQGFQVQFVEEC